MLSQTVFDSINPMNVCVCFYLFFFLFDEKNTKSIRIKMGFSLFVNSTKLKSVKDERSIGHFLIPKYNELTKNGNDLFQILSNMKIDKKSDFERKKEIWSGVLSTVWNLIYKDKI
jgi:hypothetical protein